MLKRIFTVSLAIFVLAGLCFIETSAAFQLGEECTIGAASGSATSDGRPMIWKTRDTSARDNEVFYDTSHEYKFIAVISARSTTAWQGLNEHGFAILNSASSDLSRGRFSGLGNGSIMSYALGTCATVADFERLLDSTNVAGRRTNANFAVLDATGAAAIFETGNKEYWKVDANNRAVAPDGYVLRTNFAFNGGGSSGIERYERTVKLFDAFYAGGKVSYRDILRTQMRDFTDADNNPISVPFSKRWDADSPFGYIYTSNCICRSSSVSATVIQGVLPGEPAKLSTMWTMLGQPAASITVPYWAVGETPPEAYGPETAPLCDIARKIYSLLFDYEESNEENQRARRTRNYLDSFKLRDGKGNGLWAKTFPAEDLIFAKTEVKLAEWRKNGVDVQDMLATESELAAYALSVLEEAYAEMEKSESSDIRETIPYDLTLMLNYPTPFNITSNKNLKYLVLLKF